MTERSNPQVIDDDRDDPESDRRGEAVDEDGEAVDEDGEAGTEPDDGTGHLDDIEDGAGCTEIWERLSERRDR